MAIWTGVVCYCVNVRCVNYLLFFSISFVLTCLLNFRISREFVVLTICICSHFLSLNKITGYSLGFPLILVDFL